MAKDYNSYRTILFENFDPETKSSLRLDTSISLDTLYNDGDLDRDVMEKEFNKLSVRSFDEFVEKFVPDVYQNVRVENDIPVFEYSFKGDGNPIKITETPYFKAMLRLYESKGKSGQSNIVFNYEDVLNCISPKAEIEDYKKARLRIKKYAEQVFECVEKKIDSRKPAKALEKEFLNISRIYDDGNALKMLPLHISDLDTKKEQLEKFLLTVGKAEKDKPLSIGPGMLGFDETGNLIVLPAPVRKNDITESVGIKSSPSEKDIPLLISKKLEKDFDNKYGSEVEKHKYEKSLVVSVFSPVVDENNDFLNEINAIEDREKRIEFVNEKINDIRSRRGEANSTYVSYLQGFIKTMFPMIEKILGVYVYFQHATVDGGSKGELPKGRGLIVSNCSIKDLLAPEIKGNFEQVIREFGKNSRDNQRIWLAIIPRLNDGNALPALGGNFNPLIDDASTSTTVMNDDRTSLVDAKMMMDILGENYILTFFSYKGLENNGFKMSSNYLAEHKKELEELGLKYPLFASFCYPNFCIMGQRSMSICDGNVTWIDEDGDENSVPDVIMPDFYVDACYASAGLVVGSQQINVLLNRHVQKDKIDADLPCVHIDFEDDYLRKILATGFNRELNAGTNRRFASKVKEQSFGFVFSTDSKEFSGGTKIENAYVWFARTMKLGKKTYMPVFSALLTNYVQARLFELGNDVAALERENAQWVLDITNKKGKLNRILAEGDLVDIGVDEETQNLQIQKLVIKGKDPEPDEVVFETTEG